jgi:tetratricopeptide (TPR) repeat protein
MRDDITSIESAVCMIRSGYCHMIGDLASAERPARRAVELEVSGAPNWRAVSLVTLGVNLFWRGQDLEALDVLQQAIPPHLPPANNLAGLWTAGLLAGISARAGDIETAHSYIRRAFDLATKHHLDEYGIAATTWITSAEVLEREGQMGEAESAALRGLELARRVQAQLETACALLCVARIRLTVGKINEAQEQLCEAREILAACPDPGPLAQLLVSTEQAFKPRPRTSMPRGRPVERLSDRERTDRKRALCLLQHGKDPDAQHLSKTAGLNPTRGCSSRPRGGLGLKVRPGPSVG